MSGGTSGPGGHLVLPHHHKVANGNLLVTNGHFDHGLFSIAFAYHAAAGDKSACKCSMQMPTA